MLSVRGLTAGYGSLKILRGLDLEVPRGQVVALLGGNGAGKTTTMHALAGIIPSTGGDILFEGRPLNGLPSHRVFAHGIALVAQGRQLFPEMTVRENLEMGALSAPTRPRAQALISEMFDRFPRLAQRAGNRAASLSGGEQQMLATGRALMSAPSLLLLDEPTTGLAPMIVAELGRILLDLKAGGLTILVVEQNVRMALRISDEVYVMRGGRIVMHAPTGELRDDDAVFRSYIG
jgi:branched-chain amino acid transport system ATP-binding protein